MSEITMFPTYSQGENELTNYTSLLLKTIYNESTLIFNDILSSILEEEIEFGVKFNQQEGFKNNIAKRNIADGIIYQKEINVFIETKISDWFYPQQIQNYIDNLRTKNGIKVLILLSDFNNGKANVEDLINKIKINEDIRIGIVSFKDLLEAIEEYTQINNDIIKNMIVDYKNYINDKGLLPNWESVIDVIPVARSLEENKKHMAYGCPNIGGRYAHNRRAKYIGLYKNKAVNYIAEIDAVVKANRFNMDTKEIVDWEVKYKNNDSLTEENLKSKAKELLFNSDFYRNANNEEGSLLILFSNPREDLNFQKPTKGGLFGYKYIEIKETVKDIDELVLKIKGKKWDEV
ncbi:MAG: hypothetical protein LBH40_00395 [Alphaproteobacteria bacterium]|nr:hypothetical protein [Alphaproteobacteria bacterium]